MVLPLVPVTPPTVSRSVGAPKNASAATAAEARDDSTTSCGTATSTGALDDESRRPGRDRLGRELVPVATGARDADEERALADGTGVVRQIGDLDRPLPDHLLRCERADERVETHQARL